MVNKCCAINCRSGYTGENKDPDVTFHSFPLHDKQLLQGWLKRIARKDFTPTKYSRLCSLHFKPEDFVKESNDQQIRRRKNRSSALLVKKPLKGNVLPSIFKDVPSYYAGGDAPPRSGLSLASSRHENDASRLQMQLEQFLKDDKIENLAGLIAKIADDMQSHGFVLHQTKSEANLILFSEEHPLSVQSTISISTELEIRIYHNGQLVPASTYKHIVSSNKVKLLSQVTNLMAFAKNIHMNKSAMKDKFIFNFSRLIDQYLEICDNDHEVRLLKFVLEEVELVLRSKHIRRYSVELLMMSYILHATSPRAYKRLLEEELLVLPSVKTLRKITMRLDHKSGLDDTQYLRMRYSQLNAFDRNVILMIDEIYVSKRIEAAGGQIFGLTEDCEVASAALCFMIKSLSSKYRDMVCIYPVRNLKAETQKHCLDKVMHLVHEVGFNVIGISVDNAAANRKFYKDFLCDGAWKEAITNNFTGGKIFLIFDPTHVIKNIYNNFLAKRVFKLPGMHCLVPAP